MYNRKKNTEEEKMLSPWKEDSYVCDYTFATRMLAFLLRNRGVMVSAHPMDEIEFNYLVRCASNLKIWQMSTARGYNRTYFENLKTIKRKPSDEKYLESIYSKNALDIDKWLVKEDAPAKTMTVGKYDRGIWVAVNPDGEYRAFEGMPTRAKEKVMVEDLSTSLEDYYGKEYHPMKWNGEYEEFWEGSHSTQFVSDKGTKCDPDNILDKFKNMTWADDPRQL